jgi:hypothetical protein
MIPDPDLDAEYLNAAARRALSHGRVPVFHCGGRRR